ncbi:MAG TPA: hypothetical protein VFA06_22425 [Actinocrinis sp.]|uniref:hypothetical protein n=1 Tax=Actinocrinis sp. TaxID=1920516 RepID=UPI002D59F95F|nr:hypothetical protein [Actinocrinis sp.]HZU58651.1 hypothetical protein [Actinocrinis sp.]
MSRKALLRGAEAVLVVVVVFVLPAAVSSSDVYLVCSAPCLIAAVVLGYLDGRTGRR